MNTTRMTRTRIWTSLIAAAVFLFAGFCIITDGAGNYRRYLVADIPFVYQLNETVPDNYIPAIERGHLEWNDVPSAYFEFTRGANTSAQSPSFDGTNLVFFDLTGVNFGPPPSNVIAFSQTWTSFSGGYHALESDLIWNARDFPPSPTGESGLIDLQGVIAHELGHHLGLAHQGPFGGPPGCGETITEAVMYGFVSVSDTSDRHLHIHDIAGISSIYPSWILTGTATSSASGDPIEGARIEYIGTSSLSVGGVEGSQRPGEVFTVEFASESGSYGNIVLDQTFDVVVDAYGFLADTATIEFNPPGGIGVTETIVHDVALETAPNAAISGTVRDAISSEPVPATVEFYGTDDPNGLSFSTTTDPDGNYSATVAAAEIYLIIVRPAAPYVDSVRAVDVFLPVTGLTMDFEVEEAEALLVDDDGGDAFESYYVESLDRLGISRRSFSVADSGTVPTDVLAAFSQPPLLIWFTGNETTEAMTDEEALSIAGHFDNGGEAIITGQNIAEYATPGNSLFADYLGIEFTDNATTILVQGFPGDIIGEGGFYLIGGAGNQTSRDYVSMISPANGTSSRTLFFGGSPGDSTKLAGIKVVGTSGWGATYFSVGLEGFNVAITDSFIRRSIRFFDMVVGVDDIPLSGLPEAFRLNQNYPNPFNPSTEITYDLPEKSEVNLLVYNMLGQAVNRLVGKVQPAGSHRTTWRGISDAGNALASGVYFYRMAATGESGNRFVDVKKMLLLR